MVRTGIPTGCQWRSRVSAAQGYTRENEQQDASFTSLIQTVVAAALLAAIAYIGTAKRCGACSQKGQCTSGRYKYLAIHIHEPARQRARNLLSTSAFGHAQRERKKKVEALFAELKNLIGLRRLRLRRPKFVREQFLLAAAAQNL